MPAPAARILCSLRDIDGQVDDALGPPAAASSSGGRSGRMSSVTEIPRFKGFSLGAKFVGLTAGLILLVSWVMDVGLYEKDHADALQRDADLVI